MSHNLEISAQQQLLLSFAFLATQGKPATPAALEEAGEFYFGRYRLDWSAALPELLDKGLVQAGPGELCLTEAGKEAAQALLSKYPRHLFFYNEFYPRAESSAAHAFFCEQVYGINLCQHGMMDLPQLEKLAEILELSPVLRLLELGCGSGRVAEFISDQSGASILGVDIACDAIELALSRTQSKRSRLDFIQADMRQLELESGAFDGIYCVDSLYGVDVDLLGRLRRLVRPGGRLAVYWSCWAAPDAPLADLQAERTPLALACQQMGLSYRTWDFSTQELQHWKNKLKVIEALQADFAAEGNQFLFRNRQLEAGLHQQYVESRRLSRYLYQVTLAP